jgi:hypothetical protein
MTPAQL